MNPNLHEDVASMQIKLLKLQLNFINFSKHYSNILDISWIFNFQLVNNQINKINFPSKRTIAVLCVKKTHNINKNAYRAYTTLWVFL